MTSDKRKDQFGEGIASDLATALDLARGGDWLSAEPLPRPSLGPCISLRRDVEVRIVGRNAMTAWYRDALSRTSDGPTRYR